MAKMHRRVFAFEYDAEQYPYDLINIDELRNLFRGRGHPPVVEELTEQCVNCHEVERATVEPDAVVVPGNDQLVPEDEYEDYPDADGV